MEDTESRKPLTEQERSPLTPVEKLIPSINIAGLLQNEKILDDDHEFEAALPQDMFPLDPKDPEYTRKSQGIASHSQYAFMLAEQLEKPTGMYPFEFRDEKGPKDISEWLTPLVQQVVVDIGAGKFGEAYPVALNMKARAYVGVDKYFAKGLRDAVERRHASMPLPCAVVREDALSFLRRLPKNSVSIFCSALTEQVVSDPKYIEEVNAEITRVLHPQGGYINYENSVFRPANLQMRETETRYGDLQVFTKT